MAGIFKAPVRGIYFFTFTVCGAQNAKSLGGFLYKNEQMTVTVGQWRVHSDLRYATNSVVLQLEVGDLVTLRIHQGYSVYDNGENLSTFSGFLIHSL